MPDRNTYLQYKRDTSRIIYWLIHTSNRLKCQPANNDTACIPDTKITVPELRLSEILSLSKDIAARATPVPTSIYKLFQSTITARQTAYDFFQRIVTQKPAPETEESNRKHKAFLDMLVESFNALGGETWRENLAGSSDDKEEDDTTFLNKYAFLDPGEENDGDLDADGVEEEGEHSKENAPFKHARGKKGKKSKGKKKRSKQAVHKTPEPSFQNIPLESYRIIDKESTITDYLLAVYNIIQELTDLRGYVQGVWLKVAEGKLNIAAAGAMCNMAVSIVKQLQFEIVHDFPGNESFDAILNTITRGNPDKAQGMFQIGLYAIKKDKVVETTKNTIDVKECFMAYAYWDLVAFIQDFQKNRNGKPTKSMLAKLDNWDPNIDLRSTSKTKRNQWRSAYTINWLYDLVLLWSSIVLQRKLGVTTGKPQHFVLENVDWSAEGKWGEHRRLWGLCEFAGEITALAMCKESTDIKGRILPHHVFQMQCIVDSFTVSRGWMYYPLKGNVFSKPSQYDFLNVIKEFHERPNRGVNYSIGILLSISEHQVTRSKNPGILKFLTETLPLLRDDLNLWLGSSKLAYGLDLLPPSRFANTNKNGLWAYSPYLCGTGLAEALEYVYNFSMVVWDKRPEPNAVLHLYNMLRQTGHISKPIELLDHLIEIFGGTVFYEGKPPRTDFFQNLKSNVGLMDVMGWCLQRRTLRRAQIGSTENVSGDLLSTTPKQFFRRKSLLALLKATNWRPEKIADADLPTFTILNSMRVMEAGILKKQKDSNATLLDNTTTHGNAQSSSKLPTTYPLQTNSGKMSLPFQQGAEITDELAEQLRSAMGLTPDYKFGIHSSFGRGNSYGHQDPMGSNNRTFLQLIQRDVVGDVQGNICPLSAISYLHILAIFIGMFACILEDGQQFEAVRDANQFKEPAARLTSIALFGQDPELLEYLAQKIVGFMEDANTGQFNYFRGFVDIWDRLKGRSVDGILKYESDIVSDPDEQCVIM